MLREFMNKCRGSSGRGGGRVLSPSRPRSRTPWVLGIAIVCALGAASSVSRAANGDLVSVSEVLRADGRSFSDLCLDSRDGTFWALGANGISAEGHRVVHLSADLLRILGAVDNPHPPGSIPGNNLTVNRGLTEALGGNLFVLASVGQRGSQTFVVEGIDRTGAIVPGTRIVLVPADADASLYGLAWDPIARVLITRDITHNKILRFDLAGGVADSKRILGVESADDVVRGRGVALDPESLTLYTPFGDIRDPGPTKIVELAAESIVVDDENIAVRTGIEVPLDEVDSPSITSIASFRLGALRLFAVLVDGNLIYTVEQTLPAVIPPSELSCRLTLSNQVQVSWTLHGTLEAGAYAGEIQVLRNGVPLATLAGNAHSYLDPVPLVGPSTYSVRASTTMGGAFGPSSCPCQAVVGAGGVIDWAALPSRACFDATVLPGGEILVTDDQNGVIARLNEDLAPSDPPTFRAPWSRPGGIAYVPRILLGIPIPPGSLVEILDSVAISNTGDNRVRLSRLADPESGTTISLRFPADVSSPRVGGMTFIPGETQSQQLFVVVERNTQEIFSFDPNGAFVSRCTPPEIFIPSDIRVTGGIDFDPLQGTYLATFSDSVARELFVGGDCPPPPEQFGFELGHLSGGDASLLGGVAISGNTLLVCHRASGSIYRTLIAPNEGLFIRGDANRDGEVNVTDASRIASYLFRDGAAPPCLDAADLDDNGALDIVDPLYLLYWLFVAGSQPPPTPFPNEGRDATFRDQLPCAAE